MNGVLHAGGRADVLSGVIAFLLVMGAALPLAGADRVLLVNGASLNADGHERSGEWVRLFSGGGTIELPARVVAGIEEIPEARPAAAPAMPVPEWRPAAITETPARALVREAALRSGLPPEFVESVAQVESALRSDAVSPKGAIGVMQLMPGTAKALGADPHDVRENIEAGTRLLRALLLKYDGDVVKALSAYNAGEGAVARYQGMPPYAETRRYVNRVIEAYLAAGGR